MKNHRIKGGDNTTLSVNVYGYDTNHAIVFLHGLGQSHHIWSSLITNIDLERYMCISVDIRGHGDSEKPMTKFAYQSSDVWAEDIHAIVQYFSLEKVFLVGWSYGGYIICDYIRKFGQNSLAGIVFTNAAIQLNKQFDMVGNGLLGNYSKLISKNEVQRKKGIERFVDCFFQFPVDEHLYNQCIADTMKVPPFVFDAMTSRNIDNADILNALQVPLLNLYSKKDLVILAEMALFVDKYVADCRSIGFENAGHASFIDEQKNWIHNFLSFINNHT